MSFLNRNVTIVIVILALVVIAGYLVWLRSKIQPPIPQVLQQEVEVNPTVAPATEYASPSAKEKVSTPSSGGR